MEQFYILIRCLCVMICVVILFHLRGEQTNNPEAAEEEELKGSLICEENMESIFKALGDAQREILEH